jgi:hypothetical protein
MPARYCINPLDPCSGQDVLVTYEDDADLPMIRGAIDRAGRDLLPSLSEACIRDLQLEIAVYHGRGEPYAWAQHAVDFLAAPVA